MPLVSMARTFRQRYDQKEENIADNSGGVFMLMLIWFLLVVAALAPSQDISHRLAPTEVARMETSLLRNPDDLSTRARLMTHYFQHAIAQPRVAHVLWVIEHHPGSKLAGSPVASVTRSDLLNTRSDYEAARLLWLRQTEAHPRDAAVLANAGRFFSEEEPRRAEQFLVRAWQLEPENKMRRAALMSFYTRVVAACEFRSQGPANPKPCLDNDWIREIKLRLAGQP